MKKKAKGILTVIIISVVCFVLIDIVLERWNVLEHITFFQKWEQEDIIKIARFFNGILSFAIANAMNILKLYLDNKKEMSKISILINNVTSIKKTKRKDGIFEVEVGEGIYFIYVNAILRNIGEYTIVECYINEKKLGISSLTKEENYNFCFRICREQNGNFNKSYTFRIKFRDERGRCYERIINLEIDESKREAKIILKGKQKKRRK